MDDYLKMAESVIHSRMPIFKLHYEPRQSLIDYPDGQSWSDTKKRLYKANIVAALTDPSYRGLESSY